jgi:hypothetical protein
MLTTSFLRLLVGIHISSVSCLWAGAQQSAALPSAAQRSQAAWPRRHEVVEIFWKTFKWAPSLNPEAVRMCLSLNKGNNALISGVIYTGVPEVPSAAGDRPWLQVIHGLFICSCWTPSCFPVCFYNVAVNLGLAMLSPPPGSPCLQIYSSTSKLLYPPVFPPLTSTSSTLTFSARSPIPFSSRIFEHPSHQTNSPLDLGGEVQALLHIVPPEPDNGFSTAESRITSVHVVNKRRMHFGMTRGMFVALAL